MLNGTRMEIWVEETLVQQTAVSAPGMTHDSHDQKLKVVTCRPVVLIYVHSTV